MAIYNIIYRSPENAVYLWNGNGFDLINNEEDRGLFYSGKSFDEHDVVKAMIQGRKSARTQFPEDQEPNIEKEEVLVNDKDTGGGHRHHMTT